MWPPKFPARPLTITVGGKTPRRPKYDRRRVDRLSARAAVLGSLLRIDCIRADFKTTCLQVLRDERRDWSVLAVDLKPRVRGSAFEAEISTTDAYGVGRSLDDSAVPTPTNIRRPDRCRTGCRLRSVPCGPPRSATPIRALTLRKNSPRSSRIALFGGIL